MEGPLELTKSTEPLRLGESGVEWFVLIQWILALALAFIVQGLFQILLFGLFVSRYPDYAALLSAGIAQWLALGGYGGALYFFRFRGRPTKIKSVDNLSPEKSLAFKLQDVELWRWILLALPLGVALRWIGEQLVLLLCRLPFISEAPLAHDALLQGNGPIFTVILWVFVGVAGPVLEEWIFRGQLYRLAEQCRISPVFYSTLCFAGVHAFEPRILPAIILFGAAMGWLRQRSGSLLPGMLSHIVFNGMTLLNILS